MGTYKKLDGGLSDHIAQVNDFQSHIKKLKNLSNQLSVSNNSPEIRSAILKEREGTMQLSKEIMSSLRQFSPSRNEKLQYDKLVKEFEALLTQFNQVCQAVIKKENDISKLPQDQRQAQPEIQDEVPQGLKQLGDISDIVQQDRRNQIATIESDMTEIHAMFKEVAEMVGDQGKMLDETDRNMDVTVKETSKAVKELEQSSKYQVSARKKLYCLLIMAIVLILFLAAVALGYIYF
ncbi:unnamed protein product [Blepharisma stoltei]|uniref:t-SNARE coiled-coil homology domain-containing protein n=1 Tax=Blepharisma stoltei TaxID=1481888 RepID=A0AAU9K3P1_9CILI|nr:unnamed protein product [Blepharisma stoltei]